MGSIGIFSDELILNLGLTIWGRVISLEMGWTLILARISLVLDVLLTSEHLFSLLFYLLLLFNLGLIFLEFMLLYNLLRHSCPVIYLPLRNASLIAKHFQIFFLNKMPFLSLKFFRNLADLCLRVYLFLLRFHFEVISSMLVLFVVDISVYIGFMVNVFGYDCFLNIRPLLWLFFEGELTGGSTRNADLILTGRLALVRQIGVFVFRSCLSFCYLLLFLSFLINSSTVLLRIKNMLPTVYFLFLCWLDMMLYPLLSDLDFLDVHGLSLPHYYRFFNIRFLIER